MSRISNTFFIATGHASLACGIAGIFLPLVPTTPFLLLSAACYARGSDKFYRWLTGHKILSPFISEWSSGGGVPLKTKIYAVSMMWIFILASAFFLVQSMPVRIMLFVIALSVAIYIFKQPTKQKSGGAE
jgi:uncharacterized membrane protein YbaN (DUF454 family)